MRLALIGTGKMGTAIGAGVIRHRVLHPEDLLAADPSPEARMRFAKETGVEPAESAADIVEQADAVLLAVKPQTAATVVQPIAAACQGRLIISIMAGVPISRLAGWFGGHHIVRVMPNTPLMVGKGATVFACDAGVSDPDREFVRSIFGALGIVYEMPEEKLDAVTALSGSGPAYVFEFVQALVEAAAAVDLPREEALALAVQTVAGAAEMLARGLGTPDELRDAVTSPGGTTAAALKVLREARFRDLIRRMVTAARDRSIDLGRIAASGDN